jgi:hypothetical protein
MCESQIAIGQSLYDSRNVGDQLELLAQASKVQCFGHEHAGIRLNGHNVVCYLLVRQAISVTLSM